MEDLKVPENQDPETVKKEKAVSKINIKPQAEKKEKSSPLIYCGPNLPGLASFAILKNGIPENVAKMIESCPAVGNLIVKLPSLDEVIQATQQAGTAYQVWYQEIKDFKGGEVSGI